MAEIIRKFRGHGSSFLKDDGCGTRGAADVPRKIGAAIVPI
jgi:hypothetical protein